MRRMTNLEETLKIEVELSNALDAGDIEAINTNAIGQYRESAKNRRWQRASFGHCLDD